MGGKCPLIKTKEEENDMTTKTVFINGEPVQVQERINTDDIVRSVNKNPSSNTVATINSGGMAEVIPKGQTIKVADGQNFQTQLEGKGGSK
jgi:hypothetical protein